MALPPANTSPKASIENWDLREAEIRSEETEKHTERERAFKETTEFNELAVFFSEIEDGENILNAIVTNYGVTGDLGMALEKTFGDESSLQRLGLKISVPDRKELIGNIKGGLGLVGEKEENPSETEEDTDKEPEMGEGITKEQTATDPEDETSLEESKNFEEIPGVPRLQRLVDNAKISPQEFEDITQNIDEKTPLIQAVKSTITESGRIQEISVLLGGNETPEKRAENFYKNMPKEAQESQGDTIMDLIAENYVQIPLADGELSSKEADFKTAVQEAANKIGQKNFPKPEGFGIAMNTIKTSDNKEVLYQALSEVFTYANNSIGKQGKRRSEEGKRAREKGEKQLQQKTTFAELIAKGRKNAETEQLARIQQVKDVKNAEENDIVGTGELDILGGGELDVFAESNPSIKKTA